MNTHSSRLKAAQRILFITGAGISVDSGLPTYRGVAGLYDNQDTEDGVPIEVALSGGMFRQRPELTWKYLLQIADACAGKAWNRGHQAIAEFERKGLEVWVLTQNIDGFHRDAGSTNVIEIHGTMRRLRCTKCAFQSSSSEFPLESFRAKAGRKTAAGDEQSHLPLTRLPDCPQCESMIRPDVVLFDEMLPETATAELYRQLDTGFDAIVICGTSALFPYISTPVYRAAREGNLTIEINPAETGLSDVVDWKIDAGATEGLEILLHCFD